MMEHLGVEELAISHLVRGVYMMMMMPVFSLGMAMNTLTSNIYGAKEYYKIPSLVTKIAIIAMGCNGLFFLINLLFPNFLLGIFTTDQNLIDASYTSLMIISVSMFEFSWVIAFFNFVSGPGNTKSSFYIEAAAVFIYLVYAYVLIEVLHVSVTIAWTSEFLYFTVMLVLALLYYKKEKKKLQF